MYRPTTIPVPYCPSIWLADLLTNEKIARARVGHVASGVPGTYFEFIQTQLQGCLVSISVTLVFPSLLKSNFHLVCSFSIFMLGDNICMLAFQASSSKGEEEGEEEEEIPSLHHAGSSSSSFLETYPHSPTWQYEVMNPDGTYSSMPLDRPEHTPNVHWPNLVCYCMFSSLSVNWGLIHQLMIDNCERKMQNYNYDL